MDIFLLEQSAVTKMEVFSDQPRPWCISFLVAAFLLTHGALLAVQAVRNAPTYDEVGHLASGIFHWRYGDFSLYRVNPPLIRLVATIPVVLAEPETDWSTYSNKVFARPEFSTGSGFLQANGSRSFYFVTLARCAIIPINLIGGWVVFRWATQLYGPRCGLTGLTLWCFCPNLLTWGAQMTPDAGAASLGVLAAWRFWRWLCHPGTAAALCAGLTLGLAELTKSSWIILFALWPALWIIWRMSFREGDGKRATRKGLAAILLLGVLVLNMGYAFENTCQRLDRFTFISNALGGDNVPLEGGNRFRGTLLGSLLVPLPANYVQGIDIQKRDFEKGKFSYLAGEQKEGGWWYYYLYALFVKTPCGFLALFLVAVALFAFCSSWRSTWQNEMILVLPLITLLLLVSLNTGFNRYVRYVVPALPFFCVFTARIGRVFKLRTRFSAAACAMCLASGCIESLSVYPYSMSYFNIAAGGPIGGKEHLLDANIDWGQDLLQLAMWLDKNPQARPFRLKYFGIVPPEIAGIEFEPIPRFFEVDTSAGIKLPRGWYAISVNHLMGYRHHHADNNDYTYFRRWKPTAMIGFSIYIYHVENSEAGGSICLANEASDSHMHDGRAN